MKIHARKRSAAWFTSCLAAVTFASDASSQTNSLLGIQLYAGLSITGRVGQTYQIKYATGLSETNTWYALTHFQLKWNPHRYFDTTCPATAQRFYRAVEVNVPTNVVPLSNMVFIPPGTFNMGSPPAEAGRRFTEGPQTEVTISRGFWMGKYEVTQEEYTGIMGTNPSYHIGTNLPAEDMTWYDATNYCGRLTEQERLEGRLSEGFVYRLPTEAEWEYACRAGTTSRFSFGDDLLGTELVGYAWDGWTSGNQSHVVGTKEPNPWGLYDMHGNVWEFCLDWYAFQLPGGSITDPTGPPTGSSVVHRGGSWNDDATECRSASRSAEYPGDSGRDIIYGFRVVLGHPYPLE